MLGWVRVCFLHPWTQVLVIFPALEFDHASFRLFFLFFDDFCIDSKLKRLLFLCRCRHRLLFWLNYRSWLCFLLLVYFDRCLKRIIFFLLRLLCLLSLPLLRLFLSKSLLLDLLFAFLNKVLSVHNDPQVLRPDKIEHLTTVIILRKELFKQSIRLDLILTRNTAKHLHFSFLDFLFKLFVLLTGLVDIIVELVATYGLVHRPLLFLLLFKHVLIVLC